MISLRAGFLHLGGTMGRPHPLDGAAVAIGQLCRFGNALARFAQCHNAGVRCPIAFAPSAAPCGLCQGDTLALSLAAIGVIVVSHLQGDLQEHRSEEHTSELQSLMRIWYA